MARIFAVLALFTILPTPAAAQDMPLSQILLDGEGWKKVEDKAEKSKGVEIRSGLIVGDVATGHATFPSGRSFQVESLPGVPSPSKGKTLDPTGWDWPSAALLTSDGGTLYVAGKAQQYLWAYRVEKDGTVTARNRYAPLRVRRGEHTIGVTGLATDRDGRIYAATEIGVQVFDPTGRLCGVLTPAAPGKPDALAFEGDTLTLWHDNTKYARKLNTRGAK
jgi:hypothetical protein